MYLCDAYLSITVDEMVQDNIYTERYILIRREHFRLFSVPEQYDKLSLFDPNQGVTERIIVSTICVDPWPVLNITFKSIGNLYEQRSWLKMLLSRHNTHRWSHYEDGLVEMPVQQDIS
ncbi:hypothetical protein KC906_02430 [Candidatus Kaiserbacteria bacterium]|nr:hypothetical protein [Candidatus Kaiserbacteria bacterium]